MKKTAQKAVESAVLAQRVKPVQTPVRIEYRFYEPDRRRDHDNVSSFAHKVIQDALVSLHILPDDGWDEITGYSDDFFLDKKRPRIEVTIIEMEEKQ